MLNCTLKTQGGKGNEDMFKERGSRAIVAAGKPTEQPYLHVADHLKHYLLQEEIDALMNDAIIPEPKNVSYRFRKSYDAEELINPPRKTKFENLLNELKETSYSSYWNKPLGTTRDLTPFLPVGYDLRNTTFGIKTLHGDTVSDLISSKDAPVNKTSPSLDPGYQLNRHYYRPSYDPNKTFGMTNRPDKRGTYAKCCVSEDRVSLGTAFCNPRTVSETDNKIRSVAPLGHSLTLNDNIKCVPKGFEFGKLIASTGNVSNCLSRWPTNSGTEFFLKCFAYLNTIRMTLSKLVDVQFFRNCYMHLKYLDEANTEWLPKDVIYNFCLSKNVRVNPTLIEPLLEMWNSFDGAQIQYRKFLDIINFTKPSPDIPKILNEGVDFLDYSTTYNDMVMPGQKIDKRCMAGLPSARYIDKDELLTPAGMCKADHISLPEESDVRVCISPTNLTLFGVSHRDMYAKRSRDVVRRVFEEAGEIFTDEKFNELWNEAKKYHSQGWVSYATFRKVLNE